MPAKSKAQARLADAVEHGFKPTGKAKGFTKAVAKDFTAKGAAYKKLPARKGK